LNAETTEAMSAGNGQAYRWLATAAAMGDAISIVLSSTTVKVAFPNIMGAFGIGQDKAQWASTGFLAALATFSLVLWPKLPLPRIDLLVTPQFASAVAGAIVFDTAIYGLTSLVPIFVQIVQHFLPTRPGCCSLPRGVLLAFIFPMSGWLADTVPPRVLLVSGFVLVAGAGSNTTFWALVGYTLIQGFGLGLIHPTLNATGLRAVSPETVSAGAGMLNLFRQLGGGAIVATVIASDGGDARFRQAFVESQTPANRVTTTYPAELEAALEVVADSNTVAWLALHHLGEAVLAQAIIGGFSDGFWFLAEMAVVAFPAWIIGRTARPG
jgi:DHA2 family multidrug resistance protein